MSWSPELTSVGADETAAPDVGVVITRRRNLKICGAYPLISHYYYANQFPLRLWLELWADGRRGMQFTVHKHSITPATKATQKQQIAIFPQNSASFRSVPPISAKSSQIFKQRKSSVSACSPQNACGSRRNRKSIRKRGLNEKISPCAAEKRSLQFVPRAGRSTTRCSLMGVLDGGWNRQPWQGSTIPGLKRAASRRTIASNGMLVRRARIWLKPV